MEQLKSLFSNPRKLLVILHDWGMTALAVLISFFLRFDVDGIEQRMPVLLYFVPLFALYATAVYSVFGLYESKWRFASLPDLANIFKSVTCLALSLIVIDYVLASSTIYGGFLFGKITIALYWCVQFMLLGGPRIAYRYFRYTRLRRHAIATDAKQTLIMGRAADAEMILRSIESGALRKVWPAGILSPSPADQEMVVRGTRVLGTLEDLERVVVEQARRGHKIDQVILTGGVLAESVKPEFIIGRARQLDIEVRTLAGLQEGAHGSARPRVARIAVEDLLLRPSVKIDHRRLERLVQGKSIAVTGGGGSIGLEICKSAVNFGASRVLVLENSEPILRAALDRLEAMGTKTEIDGRIADVRDRNRMFRMLADFQPDLVFHAAALKHIQLVERDWAEGVRTNVFGSINVADAAIAAGARGMVMISTDKAVEPVSVLGATKRLAEIYCHALDTEILARGPNSSIVPLNRKGESTRLISVRFGNVLASNGSVVPRFRTQIEAGGPVTVTHPDMVRYFMTIREASDLVITASSHALGTERSTPSIYVLNMGQPVKIVELAERMIRLSGYEPYEDIDITFTGLRDGERLNEVLFAGDESSAEIGISGVVAARPECPPLAEVRNALTALDAALAADDRDAVFRVFKEAVPDFRGAAA